MKYLLVCLLLLSSLVASENIDLSKPLPRLRLPDGRILHDVRFTTFRTLDVVVRHKLGVMPIRYEILPDEIRAAAEKSRPGGPRWFPGETAKDSLLLEGQVYITTVGAGAYKFSQVTVYAFATEHLQAWSSNSFDRVVKLPKPLSQAQTDGDGRFKITVPKDTPYFLFCQATRLIPPNQTERHEWRVPGESFKNPSEAFLTSKNKSSPSVVAIEATP